jgi:hypothetical protein
MIVDARIASIPDLGARPPSQACPCPGVKFALTNATFAFDDFSRSRYHKLWRISALPLIVSFLFRIAIRWINAHGIWYLVAGQQKLQRHWRLQQLGLAVVLPIKSSRAICTRNSCVRNARNVASALRPLPKRSRKHLLFVMELLQSLGKPHANERKPRPNRSQQSKIDNRCSGDTKCHTFATANPSAGGRDATPLKPCHAPLIHRKLLTIGRQYDAGAEGRGARSTGKG